jgi:hypothetical protein
MNSKPARDKGITERHERRCASRAGARCNCSPRYQAEAFDRRTGKRIRQTFGTKSYWGIRIYTDKGEFVATGAPRGYNEWFPVSVLVEASELNAIVFEGYFEPTGAAAPSPWNGYVWVDDILVE